MFGVTMSTFTVFGLTLRWYGVLVALAVLVAFILCPAREEKIGIKSGTSFYALMFTVIFGIICARLYYVAFNWEDYRTNPLDILYIHKGGLGIYGGILGGLLTLLVYSLITKTRFWRLTDLLAPALAIGQAIGRWGNFLNQEAYGELVTSTAYQFFPLSVMIEGNWHYATFFYESVWCLIIGIGLIIAQNRRGIRHEGDAFVFYAFLYSMERLIVEGMRTDSLMIAGVRISQALSMALLLATSIMIIVRTKKAPAVLSVLLILSVLMLGVSVLVMPPLASALICVFVMGFAFAVYRS